jgi:hypothetical protein
MLLWRARPTTAGSLASTKLLARARQWPLQILDQV